MKASSGASTTLPTAGRASDLRRENLVSLPERGWGEMILTHSMPRSGSHWTDNGRPRQRRALKHRADGDPAACRSTPSW